MTINNKALAELQKNYADVLFQGYVPELSRLSTGLPIVDYILGGGLPIGRITQCYGESSAGKTLFALTCIKYAQEQGLDCAIVDMEKTIDANRLQNLGIDVSKLIFVRPDTGDDALAITEELCKAGVDLIVLDSIAACMPRVMMETEADEFANKAFIANQAAMFARWMSRLQTNLSKANSVLLALNQTRTKIATYPTPVSLPGGKAVAFYTSIILKISTKYSDKADGVGESLYVTTKNKTAINGRKADVRITATGIDRNHAEMQVLVNPEFGIFRTNGAMYHLTTDILESGCINDYIQDENPNTTAYARGKQNCIDKLNENPLLKEACLQFIRSKTIIVESAAVPINELDIIEE